MLDAIERTALRVLVGELGLLRALSTGLRIEWRTRRGEPFADLPAAVGFSERGSRAQFGLAVVVYRVLRDRMDRHEAPRIAGRVIEEAALVFLAKNLGPITRADLAGLDEEGTRAFTTERAARFPNATIAWDEISPRRVRFTVTACRLPSLAHEAGHAELAPLFCKGDARYFAEMEQGIALTRPTTIADGGDTCPFTL